MGNMQGKKMSSGEVEQGGFLSRVFGTKDGNNRLALFLLLLENLQGAELEALRNSKLLVQLHQPVTPYVMRALACRVNQTTETFVKTSELDKMLQMASTLQGFADSVAATCDGNFGSWVLDVLKPCPAWVSKLGGCRPLLNLEPLKLREQLVRLLCALCRAPVAIFMHSVLTLHSFLAYVLLPDTGKIRAPPNRPA